MRHVHFMALFLLSCFVSCQQAQEQDFLGFSSTSASKQGTELASESILLQSSDGGKTWQDISTGLPKGVYPGVFIARDGELFLGDAKSGYYSAKATEPIHWVKEPALPQQLNWVFDSPDGLIGIDAKNEYYQKLNGTGVWVPISMGFKSTRMRRVYVAKDGSTFFGSDGGIFKSNDQGKTWKHVDKSGWMIDIVESNGVLLCTSQSGIKRSTDGGEHWEVVLSEGGVGIDLTTIQDGVAAIVYAHGDEARHIHTSKDGGTTWQRIDVGLPPSKLISSIRQVGDAFYCGHPDGIFRSDDGGKTWNLVLPTIGKKVFNLLVSNGVVYAVLREGGC